MNSSIKTRFAPSPTGFLHIGGVRTALFCFLYARAQGGQFLLRIEDTDRLRSEQRFTDEITESMKWLGLKWDNELVFQSKRLERYQQVADELIKQNLVYEEVLESKKALKFRMPKQETTFHDLVHGEVKFDASLFEDMVIMKSDGYPTYHFACVVDDHDMEISHVIRGDDHLSNTPRQICLFKALGWKLPHYAHLPLIMGEDGTPLSKRHGAVALSSYKAEGYLPEGLLNYLALLGWGPGDNQEFFKLEDLIKKFSIKRINKANTRFDIKKLEWVNAQHIKKLPETEYIQKITEFYPAESKAMGSEKWKKLALLYRNRIKNFSDLKEEASYCFSPEVEYAADLYDSFFTNRSLKAHLRASLESLTEIRDFDDDKKLEEFTRDAAQGWGIEAKDLIHPLRFALTGKTVSPGLFELMSVMGKELCLKRLQKFLKLEDRLKGS